MGYDSKPQDFGLTEADFYTGLGVEPRMSGLSGWMVGIAAALAVAAAGFIVFCIGYLVR